MAYKKKISDKQFLLDVVNKELEIAGGPHFDDFDTLCQWSKDNRNWYADYSFKTVDEFLNWKEYFMNHFYDWKPKRYSRTHAEKEFAWINLQFGLKYDFDLNELHNHEER